MSHIQSGIWEDIDNNIFVCVICTRRLTNPKVLPCLHRCCCSCLEKQIKEDSDENGKVKCVRCKYDVDATHNDANDFKTDFLVHNINKIDKIQQILKEKERESCCNCTKRKIVSKAYCFNCLGYLCDNCRKIHETNPAVQEHREALLAPEDLLRRDMNCKSMFSRISSKCDIHQNKTASQCCSDCENKVVCEKCMTESHRSHETKNLTSIVDCSKEELSKSILSLDERIDHIKKKQEDLESTMSRPILEVVKEKSEALMATRQKEVSKISNRSKFVVAKYENECSKLDKSLKSDIRSLQLSMKEEMDMVKAKYDPLISERKAKADIDRQKLDAKLERDRDALNSILKALDAKVQHMSMDLFKIGRENRFIALEMKAHFQQIILRYEDLSITAKSVFATDSDWIALKCIPVITSAAKVLSKDFKEFPSVGSLAEVPTHDVPQVKLPVIENDEVSPVNEINEGGPKSPLDNELSPFQRETASIERKTKFHSQSSEESKSSPDGSTEADLNIEKETNFTKDRKSQGEEAEAFIDEDQKVKSSSRRSEERATDTDVGTKATLERNEMKVSGHVSKEGAASAKEDLEVAVEKKQKVKLNFHTGEEGFKDPAWKVTKPIQSRQSNDSVARKMKVNLYSQRREDSEINPKEDEEAVMGQMERKEVHSQGSEDGTRKSEENATSSMKSRESSAQRMEKEERLPQQREKIKLDVKEVIEKSLENEETVNLKSQNTEDGTSPRNKPRRGSGQQKMEIEFHSQIGRDSKVEDPNEFNEVFDENSEEQNLESQNTGDGTTNTKASAKPPIQPRRGSVKQKYDSQINQEGKAGPNELDEVLVENSKKPKLNSQNSGDGTNPPIKPKRGSGQQKMEPEFYSQISQESKVEDPNEFNEVFDENSEELNLESQNTGDGATNTKASAKPPIPQPRRGSVKQRYEVDFHSQISQEGKVGPNEPDEVFVENSTKPKRNSQSSEDGRRNSEGKVKPPIKPRRGSGKQQKMEEQFLSQISQESTENPNEQGKLSTEQKEKVKKLGGVRVFPPSAS